MKPRSPGTCQGCGCATSRKSKTRCKPCSVKEIWARRGIPKIPEGVLIDDCFRAEVEKHQWNVWKSYCRSQDNSVGLHQFIWKLSGRPMPEAPLTIDHCNRNPLDNRLENLRVATKSLQSFNTKDRDRILPRGVTFCEVNGSGKPRDKPYMACITHKSKRTFIGMFATPEEASAAYEKKRAELMSLECSLSSPEIPPCTNT